MSAALRLLFVLDNYAPHVGGVETLFGRVCAGLAERGHRVRVLTRHCAGAPPRERRDGVEIVRLRAARDRYAFAAVAIPVATVMSRDADLVHATTFAASVPAAIAAKLARRPSLLTVHEVWIGRWRERTTLSPRAAFANDLLERIALAMPYDAVAAVSHATAHDFARAFPSRAKRVRVAYNGFALDPAMTAGDAREARASRGIAPDAFLVCGYGRPGMSKGFVHLARAFGEVRRTVRDARLVLVLDDGDEYRRTRDEIVRDATPETRVEPSLPRRELGALLRAADCVVVPSLCEGFGYTALEASALDRIVVASDAGSLPEVLGGKRVLVRPGDPTSIAAGIVAASRGDFTTLPQRAYPWETTIDAYEALYRETIAAHATRVA